MTEIVRSLESTLQNIVERLLTTQPASIRLLDFPVLLVKVGAKLRVSGYQGLQLIFRLSCSEEERNHSKCTQRRDTKPLPARISLAAPAIRQSRI